MCIREHSRPNDLDVNPLNIGDDELVEVTPRSIRLRKRQLASNERRKDAKRAAVA